MAKKRIERLNSLLQEVLSDVIHKEVRDPRLSPFVSITHVEITADLQHAKVHVSVIGDEKQKKETLDALQSAAGFIAVSASKKVTMRYFPQLIFKQDQSVEEQLRLNALIDQIHKEQETRNTQVPADE